MADEQAPVEGTTPEVTPEQTAETPATGSEAATNTEKGSGQSKGDPWIAMHKERTARQELESKLDDPQFIYEQAKKLGLAEDNGEPAPAAPPKPAPVDSFSQYRYFRELEQSQEKYPQLAGDAEDQIAITALMQNMGLSPLAAADRYYGKMNKGATAVSPEKEKEVVSNKEQASTVTTTQTTTSDAAEYDTLLKQSRDYTNPKVAERAHLELLKWRQTHK